MELLLLVEDREQHRRRGRGGERSRDDVRTYERAVAQHDRRQDRVACPLLDRHERGQQCGGGEQGRHRALCAAEHERHERGGDGRRAGEVE
jgi:hypothetical protein